MMRLVKDEHDPNDADAARNPGHFNAAASPASGPPNTGRDAGRDPIDASRDSTEARDEPIVDPLTPAAIAGLGAAVFALTAFVVALAAGMVSKLDAATVLSRSLAAMALCWPIGWISIRVVASALVHSGAASTNGMPARSPIAPQPQHEQSAMPRQ